MSEEERLELENDLLLHRTKAQMINMYLDLLDIIEKLKNENEQLHSIIKEVREKVNQYEIICGYYDGNSKSKRVQEKVGFEYHHTCNDVPVTLLNEIRVGHTNVMTKEHWKEISKMENR